MMGGILRFEETRGQNGTVAAHDLARFHSWKIPS
jgi:hypothetical protein